MRKTFLLLILLLASVVAFPSNNQTIMHDGVAREYIVLTPANYSQQKPCGLLLFLHGLGDEAASWEEDAKTFADKHGWICVLPQSLTYLEDFFEITAWNAGISVSGLMKPVKELINDFSEGDEAWSQEMITLAQNELTKLVKTDDEGFILAIINQVKQQYAIAQDSVFISGFSMGGFMTHRMLINHGEYFSAGVTVSGLIGDSIAPTQPQHGAHPSVMHIHGTKDDVVGYNGVCELFDYSTTVGLSADKTVDYWRTYNQCSSSPTTTEYPDLQPDGLTFTKYEYTGGAQNSAVAFIKVTNGEHEWYGPTTVNDIDYFDEIHTFCSQHAVHTALNTVNSDRPIYTKYLQNGKVILHLGDNSYSILGQKLK